MLTSRSSLICVLCTAWLASACSVAPHTRAPGGSAKAIAAFDHARFVWVSARCVDGPLDLAPVGFERTLRTELRGSTLRFTYDTQLAVPACVSTEVWTASPAPAGEWTFAPEAVVTVPGKAVCGAAVMHTERGVLRMSGDTLEEVRFSSPWCRGFDVRFTYQRMPAAQLRDDELIRRYAAHWNRGDADAAAALFSEQAVLIEPFTRTSDGNPQRHEGRERVRAWLSAAFATTPWLALELEPWLPPDRSGQTTVTWRYMDARLATPLRGRNLFVLSGGEIFAAELQLLDEPVPLAQAGEASSAALPDAASSAAAPRTAPAAPAPARE